MLNDVRSEPQTGTFFVPVGLVVKARNYEHAKSIVATRLNEWFTDRVGQLSRDDICLAHALIRSFSDTDLLELECKFADLCERLKENGQPPYHEGALLLWNYEETTPSIVDNEGAC